MATESSETTARGSRPIKVGIIGNSNSVMHNGYVRLLERIAGLTIVNRSIGLSPNVVLLDFLGRETGIDYDFIIIETAVVDCLQAGPLYPRERSQETLELFISYILATTKAQVIILTIPTRYALLAPDDHWQEQLYRGIATRFGVPILDGFQLIRSLIGSAKMNAAGTYLRCAEQLAVAFGLPSNIAPSLAWRDLRDRFVATNALGVAAFIDHAHFSGAIHSLVGSMLADFILSAEPDPNRVLACPDPPASPPVIAIGTTGGNRLVRSSSLMSRELTALPVGETVRYECPPGYRAYGLLLNQSKTFCYLKLTSPAGSVAFDMRFKQMPFDWIGVVVPIIDCIGNGVIEVTALDAPPASLPCHQLHNTDNRSAAWHAELGQIILVHEDWRNQIPVQPPRYGHTFHLEETTSARSAIDEAARQALPVIQGIETDGRFLPTDCNAAVGHLLTKGSAALSLADQARLLLILGMADRLPEVFKTAISQHGADTELQRMANAFLQSRTAISDVNIDPPVSERPANGPANIPASSPPVTMAEAHAAIPAPDRPLEAWIRAAEQASDCDRIAVLEDALANFPQEIRLLHDLARAHEKQGNWDLAERYWRRYIARDGRHWWVHAALAAALRAQDRSADSDVVLQDAVRQFPDEPQILAELARAKQSRGDVIEATRIWDLIITCFPAQWIGHRGKAQTLAHAGRHAEADELIVTCAPKLPHNTDALHDLARLAERRREWRQAEMTWRSFIALEQRAVWAYLALAQALRAQARYQEAADVLREALLRFPNDVDLAAEAARCAELLEDMAGTARI